MSESTPTTEASTSTEPTEEQRQAQVITLSQDLLQVINAKPNGLRQSIVLDALFTAYLSAAASYGLVDRIAGVMLNVGASLALQQAKLQARPAEAPLH